MDVLKSAGNRKGPPRVETLRLGEPHAGLSPPTPPQMHSFRIYRGAVPALVFQLSYTEFDTFNVCISICTFYNHFFVQILFNPFIYPKIDVVVWSRFNDSFHVRFIWTNSLHSSLFCVGHHHSIV